MTVGTTEREIVLSDEKSFTVEAAVNNQNDIVYAKSSAVIDESVRTVIPPTKVVFPHGVGCSI